MTTSEHQTIAPLKLEYFVPTDPMDEDGMRCESCE
ncbi:hypothetical protein ABIB54_000553 [Frigoribacterium sp. UYMn621]